MVMDVVISGPGSLSSRELIAYLSWGGMLEAGVNEEMSYVGGFKDCVLLNDTMGFDEVKGVVEEAMEETLNGRFIWYNLKYNRNILLHLRRDIDVTKMVKGNDDHAYLYIGGIEEPLRRATPCVTSTGSIQLSAVGNVGMSTMVGLCDATLRSSSVLADVDPYVLVPSHGCNESGGLEVYNSGSESMESSRDEDVEGKYGNGGTWTDSTVESANYMRRMSIWRKEILGEGQVFPSAESFRRSIFKYAIAHRFQYRYETNCSMRIVVKCVSDSCKFYICVRGIRKRSNMIVKDFVPVHQHSVGEQCKMGNWGKRKLRANLLAELVEGKVRLSADYTPKDIMQDMLVEFGIRVSYQQAWRSREYIRMLVLGKPEDHYKLDTHDMPHVDDGTGSVVGGEDLGDCSNRQILPPINARQKGKPKVKRRESQSQDTTIRRCSKCGEGGHYKRTCRNPRADVDADYEGDYVPVEDLLVSSVPCVPVVGP